MSPGSLGFWRIAITETSRPAIISCDGGRISYGALLWDTRRIALRLSGLGLRRGDVVAVVAGNEAACCSAVLAGLERGLYVAPLSSHLGPDRIADALEFSAAAALITTPARADESRQAADEIDFPFERRLVVGRAEGFRALDDLPTKRAWLSQRSPGLRMRYTPGENGDPTGLHRRLPSGDPDDVFGSAALLTCRRFGIPVMSGAHLVCGSAYNASPYIGATTALHAGITVVFLDRWSPLAFLSAVEEHGVTSTHLEPSMIRQLLTVPKAVRSKFDLSSLCSVFHSDGLPADVTRRLTEWMGPIVHEVNDDGDGVATRSVRPAGASRRPGGALVVGAGEAVCQLQAPTTAATNQHVPAWRPHVASFPQ